jgi:hypothetical protein
MPMPKTCQEIQVFNGMAQFYRWFTRTFASVMALNTKFLKKVKVFEWITECQTTWEDIKNQYVQAPILINLNWELEFHVHIDASQLAIGAIVAQNLTSKIDQPIMYSSRLLNFVERNYITTKREPLAMVYALHKFRHYMLGNMFTFLMDHIALIYLVNKP